MNNTFCKCDLAIIRQKDVKNNKFMSKYRKNQEIFNLSHVLEASSIKKER
jgi:hypothetical protein